MTEKNITEEMDILSYADIYTALSEDRPYRDGMSLMEIKEILESQFRSKHGEKVYKIVIENIEVIDKVCKSAIRDGINRFQLYEEMVYKS